MWDLEVRLAHALIPPSAGLAPPANPDQPPIPRKERVTHLFFFPTLCHFLLLTRFSDFDTLGIVIILPYIKGPRI